MAFQTPIPHTDTPSQESEWMPLREFAELLGISLTTAYELARRDDLPVPAHRVGRQFRFSRKAYDALRTAQHEPKVNGDSQAA